MQLSVDDSVAQARIAMGVPREEAENGPQAHAITKWLGRDSPDFAPMTGSMTVRGPGWLLVCSDGLWNYASEARPCSRLIAELERRPIGTRCRSPMPWSAGPTSRAARTTSPSRSPLVGTAACQHELTADGILPTASMRRRS